MAITILKQPTFDLAGNRIWLKVSTNNFEIQVGNAGFFSLTFTDVIDVDDWIKIESDELGFSVTMTAKAVPDDSGYQYSTYSGLLANTADAVIPDLRANPILNEHFIITDSGAAVILRVRYPLYYDVTVSDNDDNVFNYGSQTGVDPVYNPNFQIFCRIRLEDEVGSGDLVALPLLSKHPDENSEARFNLAPLLKTHLPHIELDWNENILVEFTDAIKAYEVELNEYYGDPPEHKIIKLIQFLEAAYGTLTHFDHSKITTNIEDDLYDTTKWITNKLNNRVVTHEQQHYLAWYNHAILAPLEYLWLIATVYYDDATSSSIVIDDTDTNDVGQFFVGIFPCGFIQCELHLLQPSKTPTHYDVWIEGSINQTDYSTVRTFILEDEGYLDTYFEFINSWGYPESIRCTGGNVLGVEVQIKELFVDLDMEYDANDTSHQSAPLYYQRKVDVNTGFLSKDELLDAIDFLFSKKIWYMDTVNQRKVGGLIPSDEYELVRRGTADADHQYAINFSFYLDQPETGYSRFDP